MVLRGVGTPDAYRFRMCSVADGELEGQISINDLLVAMGEAPVEPIIPAPAPDDAPTLRGRRRCPGSETVDIGRPGPHT